MNEWKFLLVLLFSNTPSLFCVCHFTAAPLLAVVVYVTYYYIIENCEQQMDTTSCCFCLRLPARHTQRWEYTNQRSSINIA